MLQIWFALHTLLWPVGIKLGDSVLSLNVVLLLPIGIFWLLRNIRISKTTLICAGGLILFLLFSVGVAKIGPCEDKITKAVITAPILTILLIIGLEIGARAKPADWLNMRTTAFRIIVTALLFIISEAIFPKLFSPDKIKYHNELKYSGIFYEPSHVAISLFPCIGILFMSRDKSFVRKGVFSLVLLFLLSHSSTLVILTLSLIIYRLIILSKLKQSLKYLSILVLVSAIAVTLNYELLIAPTVDRFDSVTSLIAEETTSSSNENLSSMIYYKGWQDAIANFTRTNGLGLGFNMMGCRPLPDTSVRRLLTLPGRLDLNNEDGSFLLSKMLSEFGIIGLAFFLWVIWRWLLYERITKKYTDFKNIEVASVQKILMFSFILTSLVRSSGYFQGSALLWVTAIIASAVLLKKTGVGKNRSIL